MWFLLSLHSVEDLLWEESPFARRALELCQGLSHLTGSEWRVINKGAAGICWCVVNLCNFPFFNSCNDEPNCAGHSMFNRTELMFNTNCASWTCNIFCSHLSSAVVCFCKSSFQGDTQAELTFRAPHFSLFVLGTSYIKCNILPLFWLHIFEQELDQTVRFNLKL